MFSGEVSTTDRDSPEVYAANDELPMTIHRQFVGLLAFTLLFGVGCGEKPNPYAKAPDPRALEIDCGEKSPQAERPRLSDSPTRVITAGEPLRVKGTIRFAPDFSDWGSCMLQIDTLAPRPLTASSGTCDQLTEVSAHVYAYWIEVQSPQAPGKYRLDVLCLQASPKYLYSELIEVKTAK